MNPRRWNEVKAKRLPAEKVAEIERSADAEVVDLNLRAVRELLGKTQEEVAAAAGMAQPELSRLERRQDHLLSTVRRYVEALGGEVEVIARFGDRSVRLRGV